MKNLCLGIEIEVTGITRERAAKTIASYFRTDVKHIGEAYDAWRVEDFQSRVWKIINDSILIHKEIVEADNTYRVEIVSPICKYEDIEIVQEIIRALRKE